MLFICVARHSAEMCPAGKVHPDKEFAATVEKAAKEAGAKLAEVYLDGPGHTFYVVLDVATNTQLWDATEPLRVIGEVQFAPVLKLAEARAQARKLGVQK